MGGVCGSDVKYYHGRINLPLPIILGHEILGRVEKLGAKAGKIHGVEEGDRVILKGAIGCGRCADCRRNAQRFCKNRTNYGGRTTCADPPHLFGGFADYLYLAPDVLMTRISDDLPPEAAALIGSVMANGFQWALRRGGVKMGDYVLIQGPGQQGLACTFASSHAGAARIFVSGIGRDAPRLELAKKWGAHRTINVEQENVVDVIREETDGAMADVVVDVSGNPRAILASIDCLRRQGTMVLAGLTGDATVTEVHMDKLVWGEIKLQGLLHRRQRRGGCHHAAHRGHPVPGGGDGEPRLPAGRDRAVHPGRGGRDTGDVPDQGVDQAVTRAARGA